MKKYANKKRAWVAFVGVLVIIMFVTWFVRRPVVPQVPDEIKLQPNSTQKIVATPCYGFLLSKLFGHTSQLGCMFNSYAEPLKDNWINIDIYEQTDMAKIEARFRERKIDESVQKIIERREISLGGQKALMLVDEYSTNRVRYATVLVEVEDKDYQDGSMRIGAFEIRGHYTNSEDKAIFDGVVSNWQWR